MRAEIVRKVELPGPVGQCHAVPGGGWWLTLRGDPQRIVLLDQDLRGVHDPSARVPTGSVCSWSPDGLAVAGLDMLALHRDGKPAWIRRHGSWDDVPKGGGACAFADDVGELWVVLRRGSGDYDSPAPDDQAGADTDSWVECQVRDVATGALLARTGLDDEVVHSLLLPHPDGRHMALLTDDGDTTDGLWIERAGSRLSTSTLDPDGRREPCAMAISPGGYQYAIIDGQAIATFRFPMGALIAEREDPACYQDTSAFDRALGYCAEDLLLDTYTGDDAPARTLVYRAPFFSGELEPIGEIDYDEHSAPQAAAVAGDGTWITAHDAEVTLWTLQD